MIRIDDPWDGEALTRTLRPGQSFNPSSERCMASVTPEGKLLGGTIFNHFAVRSMQIHVASCTPEWCTRAFLRACFTYVFDTAGVEVLYGPVDSTNEHALEFDRRIGFVEEARLVGAVPGGDIVILSMRRHQCKWLRHPSPK